MVSRELLPRCRVNVIRGTYVGFKGLVLTARRRRLRVILDDGFLVWLNRLSCERAWEDELEELVTLLCHHNTHSVVAEATRRMQLLMPTR